MLDPWESASVAEYRSWAREKVAAIEARGNRVLFVGGTALYLKALLRGLFEGPGADPELRQVLEAEADRLGDPALHARLAAPDPATAARLHPRDRRRVIRALEVIAATGQPLSRLQTEHDRPAPAEVTAFAIERRAGNFTTGSTAGWCGCSPTAWSRKSALQSGPRPLSSVAAQGVGYREVIDRLEGRLTSDEELVARCGADAPVR